MVFVGSKPIIRTRFVARNKEIVCESAALRFLQRERPPRQGQLRAVFREPQQNACLLCALSTRRQFLSRAMTLSGVLAWVVLGDRRLARATGSSPGKVDISKFIQDPSGVLYRDYKAGSGSSPKDGDLVVINYIGYLSNGMIFDNTTAKGRKPLAFIYGKKQMVPGVEKGIETMKVGGKRRLIVPSDLAFGERGVCLEGQGCLVPPNETVTYDVELLRVSVAPF
ncbi:hypothetical protein CCYA_CCYA01G0136 [Cyanidiococcus yangmingshanensis]|nr:hypothetical protein CCYA_CCYA01G0136 [Cyanidiococcus yangmingshanensis]